MSDPDQAVIDPSDLRKYRTELPNLYDDSDLDVYEFRLLAHYKRVGTCTEGLETTARKCRMSEGKASEVRQALAEKGFVSLKRVSMDAGRYRFIVTVLDRWIENFARYSGFTVEEILEKLKKASPSRGEASPSHSEASPSPHEGKKELIKKEPIKKLTTAAAGKVFTAYENEIGAITAMTADALKDAEQIYGADWIIDAISEAALNNKRNLKYCEAILKRWKAEGRQSRRQPKTDARVKSTSAASTINQDIIRKVAQNAKTR